MHRALTEPSYLGEASEEGEEEQPTLLRFATHRDPVLIARQVRYKLLEPEHENWNAEHWANRVP